MLIGFKLATLPKLGQWIRVKLCEQIIIHSTLLKTIASSSFYDLKNILHAHFDDTISLEFWLIIHMCLMYVLNIV